MGQSGQEIRNAIQRGEISAAIEKVNDLNPEILDTNPQLFFHLQKAVTLFPHTRRGARTHTDRFSPSSLQMYRPRQLRAVTHARFKYVTIFRSTWSIPRGRRHVAACDAAHMHHCSRTLRFESQIAVK